MKYLLLKTPFLFVFMLSLSARAAVTPLPDDPACTDTDRLHMKRAFELATEGVKTGNAPFGALLVKDGKVIAEYHNSARTKKDITHHAETGLISAFSGKFDRATFAAATLYTSAEPCTMCCGAIRFAGIGRVVYGVTETQFERIIGAAIPEKPLTSKEVFARTAPEVKVLGPLMEAEGLVEHEKFWPTHVNPARPRVHAPLKD